MSHNFHRGGSSAVHSKSCICMRLRVKSCNRGSSRMPVMCRCMVFLRRHVLPCQQGHRTWCHTHLIHPSLSLSACHFMVAEQSWLFCMLVKAFMCLLQKMLPWCMLWKNVGKRVYTHADKLYGDMALLSLYYKAVNIWNSQRQRRNLLKKRCTATMSENLVLLIQSECEYLSLLYWKEENYRTGKQREAPQMTSRKPSWWIYRRCMVCITMVQLETHKRFCCRN